MPSRNACGLHGPDFVPSIRQTAGSGGRGDFGHSANPIESGSSSARDRDVLWSAILPCNPRVTVEAPLLRGRPESPGEPIPHHYPNRLCSEQPVLCLHDPLKFEWLPVYAIADTIVPWTIEWLACYEVWLALGTWTGGGRHPELIPRRHVRRR